MNTTDRKNHGCLGVLTNYSEAVERFSFANEAVSRLIRYRDTVNLIERCPGAGKHLGERAMEAENDTRVLLKCAIDCLNELRDSREIENMTEGATKMCDGYKNLDIDKVMRGAKDIFREKLPEADLSYLDESEKVLKQYSLQVQLREDKINAKFRVPDGKEHSIDFAPKVRPGDLGRVGSSDFFSSLGPILTLGDPAFAEDDCHHRSQRVQLKESALVDVYAHLIGAFAHARDAMARHTRIAEHFGRPHLKAQPPAVLIAIGIVAAILIIAGATLLIGCAAGAWSGSACDWGWGLLLAGAAIGVTIACIAAPGPCVVTVQNVVVAVIGA